MPKIPLYEQRVAPTTQIGGVEASAQAAEAPWQALAGMGETVSKIGFGLQEKINAEESEAQTAKYYADRKIRANTIRAELSTMTDPKEIAETYKTWREDEGKLFNETELTGDARRNIENSNELFYADVDIATSGIARKAQIQQSDRAWIDIQSMALSGESDDSLINPDTNSPYTPKELYEYATLKRVGLGTVGYEEAQNDIRSYGENLQYRQVVTLADNNPEEADRLLRESNLTGEKLVLATDAVRDAREMQDRRIKTEQDGNISEINREIQAKRMSRTQLEKMSNATITIMGKTVPAVPKEVIDANRLALDAAEDFDAVLYKGSVNDILDSIDAMATNGGADGGEKDPPKVYKSIANLGLSGASKPTIEGLLRIANKSATQYAFSQGWNTESAAMMNEIATTYSTLYAEMPTKYKNVDPIAMTVRKIESFIELVDEHKGNPTSEQIKEWRKEHFGEEDNDAAVNDFSKVYNINKPLEAVTKVYRGNGIFEVG